MKIEKVNNYYMKPKIDTLIDRCYSNSNIASFNNSSKDNNMFFNKKQFAKLIIDECAKIVQVDPNTHTDLLKHFGIK